MVSIRALFTESEISDFCNIHSSIRILDAQGCSGMLLRSGMQPAAWDLQGSAPSPAVRMPGRRPAAPKAPKPAFLYFFQVLRVPDQSQSLLQALKLNFPSKMCDLDAYLPSYATFRRFSRVYCPGTATRRTKEAVIKSAASAASLGFAGERQDDGPACRLDHGFLNTPFGSAGTVPP